LHGWRFPSFRDGPKDQTSGVRCTSGKLEIPGSRFDAPRNDDKTV
jgi:hypothetical protein